MENTILKLENISYKYNDAAPNEYVLRDINYKFECGKIYAIKGKSGSGKTTLLSLLSGLEKCTDGHIYFEDKNLSKMNLDVYRNSHIGIIFQSYNLLPHLTASENIILSMDISKIKVSNKKDKMNLDVYRNSHIGIIFQSYNLLPHLTASENIILSMDISKIKVSNKKEKAIELLKSVGLSESYADRMILKLSGGEQQRVAIARSLSYDSKMILADEPTGNLDKDTENEILKIFKRLAKEENKCVIIV